MEELTLLLNYIMAVILVGTFFGLITRYLAKNKGYEGGFWWGFFLAIIGVLVVGLRKDNTASIHYPNSNVDTSSINYSSSNVSTANTSSERNAPQITSKEKEGSAPWVCTCGQTNRKLQAICWYCGKPRVKPSGNSFHPAMASTPRAFENDKVSWECTVCKQQNIQDAQFCMSCGTKRPTESNDEWRCSDCSALNSSKGQFCIHCGKKRDQ